jgi:N-acetylmuramoyl-L-alanine amidase
MLRITSFLYVLVLTYSLSAQNQFITGKTSGQLPYLEYGLGTDRLGGAKMAFLDTGIVVKVVDSTPVNYRVQLSANHFAYLSKNNFKKDTGLKNRGYYLTASLLINGDSAYDYVSVTLDEKLPYRSIQLINPSKIAIDIFGATSNTNWVTHRTSAKEIKNVYHEQVEDDVFRIIIELKHNQHWGYSIYYEGKKLMIKVKRQPSALDLSKMKIVVDAGHGGSNTGATGKNTGIQEKKYTLLIAKQLEKALRDKEANVVMTRNSDTDLSMADRLLMAKNEDPDFLISIHLNSSVKDSVKGVSTYYKHIGFRPLTQYIQERMVTLGLFDFGNVGSFNFLLNAPTDYPNCLVEVAFLSNVADEKLILDPAFHKAVAERIVEGIKEWLKACRNDEN